MILLKLILVVVACFSMDAMTEVDEERKNQENCLTSDLNPNATEFVPGSTYHNLATYTKVEMKESSTPALAYLFAESVYICDDILSKLLTVKDLSRLQSTSKLFYNNLRFHVNLPRAMEAMKSLRETNFDTVKSITPDKVCRNKLDPANAFAGLTKNGNVYTWGEQFHGGNSNRVKDELHEVKTIVSTASDFAALRQDGKVFVWGIGTLHAECGVQNRLNAVQDIFSNGIAFAAVKQNEVVTWGGGTGIGSDIPVQDNLNELQTVFTTLFAFAALKKNGNVVTWGDANSGGDSSSVKNELIDIKTICGNDKAFAALKKNGNVVTWGAANYGGDSSSVEANLKNIKTITPLMYGFRATKEDGQTFQW